MSFSSLLSLLRGGVSASAIEHDEMQKACMEGGCHIVDVREAVEFEAGHLPGAVSHPLSRFDPSLLPKDKPVVLVCQSGSRSARALGIAHQAGRTDIKHYPPGTSGWRARGGKIAR